MATILQTDHIVNVMLTLAADFSGQNSRNVQTAGSADTVTFGPTHHTEQPMTDVIGTDAEAPPPTASPSLWRCVPAPVLAVDPGKAALSFLPYLDL